MSVHQRRLKKIIFDLGGNSFQCQVKTWKLDPGEEDGDRMYSFCDGDEGSGEFIEDTDDEPTLELTFFSDWRSAGVSRWLWEHRGETVPFQLDHHPDIPAEHQQFSGKVKIKAPAVGGDARATEESEVTLQVTDLDHSPVT